MPSQLRWVPGLRLGTTPRNIMFIVCVCFPYNKHKLLQMPWSPRSNGIFMIRYCLMCAPRGGDNSCMSAPILPYTNSWFAVCVFVGEAQLIDKSQPSLLYGGALYSQHPLRFQEIKQNIGFGLESMKVWFDTIVEAQHLTPDRCIMVSMGRHSRTQKQNQANKNISTGKHQTWSRSDLRTGLPGWLLVQNSVCIEPEPMAGAPRPQETN